MMMELLITLKLLFVEDIQISSAESTIVFEGGSQARLPSSHTDYQYFLTLSQRSQSRHTPVAVAVSDGVITEMMRADSDIVSSVDIGDTAHVRVKFRGHDGIYRLRRDHPEFSRLNETLTAAQVSGATVWFAATKPTLSLVDVTLTPATSSGGGG